MADADSPLDAEAALPTNSTAAVALAPPVASGDAPSPPPTDAAVMPLFDHLAELRRRIAICLLAVAAGTIAGFAFGQQIIEVLKAPYGEAPLLLLAPGEGFFISLKISIVVGIVLAMPIILFQLWRFVSPGLTSDERRMARPWVPLALVFFVAGVAVAYFVLPFTVVSAIGFVRTAAGVSKAWDGAGSFTANRVKMDNAGATDWAATDVLFCLASG